jgi:DNA-binding HxlR family transcriptional regulator
MTNNICTSTPVGITLKVIGGKWKLLILWHLKAGTMRFGELKKHMTGVTQKMLTQELRELEADGLIIRKVFASSC